MINRAMLAAAASVAVMGPAKAHHVMDGAMPTTFGEGLLSGLGHPIIGLDHLAFVIAVGLVAFLHGRKFLLPAAFIVAMVGGVAIHLARFTVPGNEVAIALSVSLLGAATIRAHALPVTAVVALTGLSGIFHGYAYAESIVGSESSPLAAYLIGLVVVQLAIACGVAFLVGRAATANPEIVNERLRIVGGIVVGIGAAFLASGVAGLA